MNRKETLVETVKGLHRKKGEEISDEAAELEANNLNSFFEFMFKIGIEEVQRQKRLKKEREGFPIDGIYSCAVCKNGINENTGWYSKYGKTCFHCLKALKEKVVPNYILKNENSYFSMSDLNYVFNIKTQAAKKYMREGKIIPRIILDNEDKPHHYIFLKKENPTLIKRYCPERKSYDRHHNKKNKQWSQEMKEKLKEDLKKVEKREVDKSLKIGMEMK